VSEPTVANDVNYTSTDNMQLRIYRKSLTRYSIKVLNDDLRCLDKISLKWI